MNYNIIAVWDNAIQAYNTPITVPHVGSAVRAFIDEVQNKETEMGKHPTDYELWVIAQWNAETGEYSNGKERIARGADHV